MTALHHEDWTMLAKCRGMEDGLFPEASEQKRARLICAGCPVRFECLAEALDNKIEWGVWGGMTERERRALLRARPDVTSWTDLLIDARDAHYASAADETADGLAIAAEQATAEHRMHESA